MLLMAWKAPRHMEPEYTMQLQHILERMAVGVAILDCTTLRVLYANSYLTSFCPEPWRSLGLTQRHARELLPADIYQLAEPLFRQVCVSGEKVSRDEVPYEGFLETRGRTYWQISLELAPSPPGSQMARTLLVMLEDVTAKVRARLHLEAIRHISAAIAGQSPLHDVLDRILLAMHELVGSKRCAVLLIDHEEDETIARRAFQENADTGKLLAPSHTATSVVSIVAEQGLYPGADTWHPQVDERLLLSQVLRTRQALVVPDTSALPSIEFPVLNDDGKPRRPGSVVCVPILETLPEGAPGAILGTIEIYHRRARGLADEEVKLLEQFAPQAGLAIQHARLFQRIKLLARVARQQAHQLKNVMHAIPDGVIIYDARWHLLEINHMARRLLGWSDADIGLHISQAITHSKARFPQNSPQIADLIADLERHAEYKTVDEFEMVGADGNAYAIRRSKAPIRDETGQIFAYVVVYHDVTEQAAARKQIEAEVRARTAELAQRNADLQEAQDALRLYADRLQLLLGHLPTGVIFLSLQGQQAALINTQAEQLLKRLGIALPEGRNGAGSSERPLLAVSGRIEELLRTLTLYDAAGAVVPYEQQPLYLALHQLKASEAELAAIQTDGATLNLLINAAPLLANDGRVVNVVLVWQDITWIKAMERAREHFFTTMAHELKTPLANIRAHLSALQARDMSWSPDAQLDFLRTADEQVERLVDMINHFLDASRVEAGALHPEFEPILLPEMFEDLQERLEALISSSQRRLEIHIEEALPAVNADYELVMGVLINLLSNAFRYTPVGDVVVLEAVLKKGRGQPQAVTLRVIDHGPGIPPQRQAALFTRFSTFAAARRPAADRPGQPAVEMPERRRADGRWSSATGLGLYISKGIIEAHGSTLELESSPGEGTIFSFSLGLAGPARHEF
jgi:PAS domain S-box-containing protein